MGRSTEVGGPAASAAVPAWVRMVSVGDHCSVQVQRFERLGRGGVIWLDVSATCAELGIAPHPHQHTGPIGDRAITR